MPPQNFTLDFLHTCETAFLAAGTNTLNIINIFEGINVNKGSFPITFPKFSVVTGIKFGKAGKYIEKIRILYPETDEILVETSGELNVESNEVGIQFIGTFFGVVLTRVGKYPIKVFIDDKELERNVYSLTLKEI